MVFHPPGNRRERLLIYGPTKNGKSTTWLDIAEWLYKTGSPNKIWLGDSDVAWEAMRPLDGHLDAIVQHRDLNELPSYKGWIEEAYRKAAADKNDWLVMDMADRIYEKAKAAYYQSAFGKELDEFFLEAKGDTTKIGGAYGANWDVINKMYNAVMDPVQRFPGHVLACAPADKVELPNEKTGKGGEQDAQIRDMYGSIGWKPKGQKMLGHLFHSVLFIQKSPSGYRLTTVGDRQRADLVGETIGELRKPGEAPKTPLFVVKYLIAQAGWRP